jgi:hypothetical protein
VGSAGASVAAGTQAEMIIARMIKIAKIEKALVFIGFS